MLVALLVLTGLLVSAVVSWRRPSRAAAFVLVVFCALWFPANNGHLEGPVLLSVDSQHGLSSADLLSYSGFALALVTVLRWWDRQMRHPTGALAVAARRSPDPIAYVRAAGVLAIVGLFCVLGLGLAFDWVHQPG